VGSSMSVSFRRWTIRRGHATKFSAVCAAIVSAVFLSSTLALGQLGPSSEPSLGGYIENVEGLYANAKDSLARALSTRCLDPDVKDGTVALVQKAIAQLKQFRSNPKNAQWKGWMDYRIGHLESLLLQLLFKKPCPSSAFPPPTSLPPVKPGSTAPPVTSGQCLTPEEVAEVQANISRLEFQKQKILANIGLLKADQSRLEADRREAYDDIESLKNQISYLQSTGEKTVEYNGEPMTVEQLQSELKEKQTKYDDLQREINSNIYQQRQDAQRASNIEDTIQNLKAKIPCPPAAPQQGAMLGPHLGGQILETFACSEITERDAFSDRVTNRLRDCKDPLGIGVVAGYNFAPWNNNIVVGPFFSFDWLRQTINHTFPGGTFLGTTTHWITTTGAKVGVATAPGILVYGLAGASWLNHDLNVNFATAASRNTTTPGFTLGLGGEFRPSMLQGFGMPVGVFAQYQHTWWGDAPFNTPTSSPAFNYTFRREEDAIRVGLNFYFAAPPPPAPAAPAAPARRPYPVKAPPLK
jgi:opacity protein-like surface antigen